MSTKLRISVVVDGVTLPDLYFDHPGFSGNLVAVTMFANHSPEDGLTDQYATAPAAPTKTANTLSLNDSKNPRNYSP